MTDRVVDLLRANLLIFGERDHERRRALMREAFAADIVFTDPDGSVIGPDAVDLKIRALHDRAPGFVFASTGPAYAAADFGAIAWTFGPADGDPVVQGIDVITVRDGRISELTTALASGQ